MKFWKRQSYGDRKKIIGCQKFWERKGLEKWSIGDYQRLVKYWWGVLLVYVLMDPIGHIWTYWLTTSCYLVIKLCQMTPMDYSLPGSSVHGISQARILEWVAISFSRGSSQPRDQSLAGRFSTTESPGKPLEQILSVLLRVTFRSEGWLSPAGFSDASVPHRPSSSSSPSDGRPTNSDISLCYWWESILYLIQAVPLVAIYHLFLSYPTPKYLLGEVRE